MSRPGARRQFPQTTPRKPIKTAKAVFFRSQTPNLSLRCSRACRKMHLPLSLQRVATRVSGRLSNELPKST